MWAQPSDLHWIQKRTRKILNKEYRSEKIKHRPDRDRGGHMRNCFHTNWGKIGKALLPTDEEKAIKWLPNRPKTA